MVKDYFNCSQFGYGLRLRANVQREIVKGPDSDALFKRSAGRLRVYFWWARPESEREKTAFGRKRPVLVCIGLQFHIGSRIQ